MALCLECLSCLKQPRALVAKSASSGDRPGNTLRFVSLTLGPGVRLSALAEGVQIMSGDGTASGYGGDATGARPWWGGLLLAAWVAHNSAAHFSGRSVIELGCGSAPLPSVAAALRGASMAVATDGCPTAVRAVRTVLDRNGPTVQRVSSTRRLAWEEAITKPDIHAWDVILFADVICTEDAAQHLARVVEPLLRHGGEVVGAIGLHRIGAVEIFEAMRRQGFVAKEIPVYASVLSSATKAAEALQAANASDLMEVHSTFEDRCKLVRWVRRELFSEPDMTDDLRAQAVQAFFIRESKVKMAPGWEPTE